MMSPSSRLLFPIICVTIFFCEKILADPDIEQLDESFFLFLADMPDEPSALDPLSMLAFDQEIESSVEISNTQPISQQVKTKSPPKPSNNKSRLIGEPQP